MGNGVMKIRGKLNNGCARNADKNGQPNQGGGTGYLIITVAEKPMCTLTDLEKQLVYSAWDSVERKTVLGELILTRIFQADATTLRVFRLDNVEGGNWRQHKRFAAAVQQLASFLDTVIKSLTEDREQMTEILTKSCKTFGSKHIKVDETENADTLYWRLLPDASAEEVEANGKGDSSNFHNNMDPMSHIKRIFLKFMNDLMPYITMAYVESKKNICER